MNICLLPASFSSNLADEHFLPGLLKRYHALCPQVELVLCTATADGMLQMLGTNQIDLAYTLDQPLLQ